MSPLAEARALTRSTLEVMRPKELLLPSQWCDKYSRLVVAGSDHGRWQTLPYQREPLDAMNDPSVETIVFMKAARVGFTSLLVNFVGYLIANRPGGILLVQPTIDDAEKFSKEDLATYLDAVPTIRDLIVDVRSRSSGATMLDRKFRGGTVQLVGANSPGGFRRVSRRVVLLDEIDGYPVQGAGSEGDQIALARRRASTYRDRKIVMGSTPTIAGLSRVDREFQLTDQRRYFVPCPHCDHMQPLQWSNLQWANNDPSTAHYLCESCQGQIRHRQKISMIEKGEWRPTALPARQDARGYHINALYSYSPGVTWARLVEEFLAAKKSPDTLKTWINTALGEVWQDDVAAGSDPAAVKARAENYPLSTVPDGVLILTAGVDVQADRLEVGLYGWGEGEECWSLGQEVILGSPTTAETWARLNEYLAMSWPRADGNGAMSIEVMAIDSGFTTNEVYAFARAHPSRVIAIKGSGDPAHPAIARPKKVDVTIKGRTLKKSANLSHVGSGGIKTTLYGRLANVLKPGPGYIHFSHDSSDEYFLQICSEILVTRYVKGRAAQQWEVRRGVRNEALDCWVYAYAALQSLYFRYARVKLWSIFRAKRGGNPLPPPVFDEATGETVETVVTGGVRRRVKRKGIRL